MSRKPSSKLQKLPFIDAYSPLRIEGIVESNRSILKRESAPGLQKWIEYLKGTSAEQLMKTMATQEIGVSLDSASVYIAKSIEMAEFYLKEKNSFNKTKEISKPMPKTVQNSVQIPMEEILPVREGGRIRIIVENRGIQSNPIEMAMIPEFADEVAFNALLRMLKNAPLKIPNGPVHYILKGNVLYVKASELPLPDCILCQKGIKFSYFSHPITFEKEEEDYNSPPSIPPPKVPSPLFSTIPTVSVKEMKEEKKETMKKETNNSMMKGGKERYEMEEEEWSSDDEDDYDRRVIRKIDQYRYRRLLVAQLKKRHRISFKRNLYNQMDEELDRKRSVNPPLPPSNEEEKAKKETSQLRNALIQTFRLIQVT